MSVAFSYTFKSFDITLRDEIYYSGHSYALPKEFLRQVTHVRPYRGAFDILGVWLQVAFFWWVGQTYWNAPGFWWVYPVLAFLIAGRLGAFLQLIHEASHYSLFAHRTWNNRAAKWFCALPIGVFFEGYASGHRRHHAYTNTSRDPLSDREKYRVTDFRDPKLYLLFLKDIVGWTALSIFFSYKETEEAPTENEPSKVKALPELCLVQLFILMLCFKGNVLQYVFLWIFPAISPHMVLMRVRGIAEHGLSQQLGKHLHVPSEGTFYTRSFLTPQNTYRFAPAVWLEKYLIGSFSVHYHHEHHLFPNVPFYHLKEVHERIAARVAAQNPDVYASGYVAAAVRNLFDKSPLPEAVSA